MMGMPLLALIQMVSTTTFLPRLLVAGLVAAAAGPAYANGPPAESCVGAYSFAEIFAGNFACQIGDKVYSNFRNPSGFSSANFLFSDFDPQYELTVTGNFIGAAVTGSTYSFEYTVDVEPWDSGQFIAGYSTDFTIGTFNPPNQLIATKTLQATNPLGGIARSSRSPLDTLAIFLPPGSTEVDFLTSLTVQPGFTISNFTDTIAQQQTPDVPGPLPILGAAAAFRASRRIRKRVKLAA